MNFDSIDSKNFLEDMDPINKKKFLKKQLKEQNAFKESEKARNVTLKLLAENPHVNIGHLIKHLQSMILSTTKCAEKLGISPTSFARLRKKYNISPVYTVLNKPGFEGFDGRKPFPINASKFAIKNFYTPNQLELISKSDIELVQHRAARSLKYPNGKGSPWKWTHRGYHPNGKLKARTNNLIKYGFRVVYDGACNHYMIMYPNKNNVVLSRAETDKLNYQYNKLKAFL